MRPSGGPVSPRAVFAALAPEDLQLKFIRAAGPGGQNVNKVASAVQLRFDLRGTRGLTDAVKARLRALAGHRLTADGALLIAAHRHRTQAANRREALQRLEDLIARACIEPLQRVPTRPTAGSKQRRLQHKHKRQQLKRLRSRVGEE